MLLTLGFNRCSYGKQVHIAMSWVHKLPLWAAQFNMPWIQTLRINIHLAVDGLSLLMVGLTALLGVFAVGCSWGEIQKNVGFFHLNLLWSLGGVIGVILSD